MKSIYVYSWYGEDSLYEQFGLKKNKAYPERFLHKIVNKFLQNEINVMILNLAGSYTICVARKGSRFTQR